MTHNTVIRSTLACLALLLLSATAHAQLFRAYVAPTGSDANPCTLTQPCRLLPAALTAVADGGEIWMLDSGNYNTVPVNITKSVTILAVPGALGSVVAAGGNAININTAGVKVALRNLVIVPLLGSGGTNGIYMSVGASLTVENCLIANLPASGIVVTAPARARVTDTIIRGNGDIGLQFWNGARATVTRATISENTNEAVFVYGSLASTTTTLDIADSTIDGNNAGVYTASTNASAVVKVSVRDSRAVRNANYGVITQSSAGAAVTFSLSNNIISNNNVGIWANTGSKVWASGNTVSNNGIGLNNTGGLFESAGNNAVRNNTNNKSGTISVIAVE